MYSPSLGRFIQPDTIVPDMFNPQSLNRYSYVLNNPIRYTDPTGHCYAVGESSVWIPDGNDGPCGWLKSDMPKLQGGMTQNSNTIILNPTHVNEQGITIIGVPAQQPNGSPSVPTIITLTIKSETTVSSSIINSDLKKLSVWTTWGPISPSVGVTIDDKDYSLDIKPEVDIPLKYNLKSTIINSTITTTTYDQNGNELDVNMTTTNQTNEIVEYQDKNGFWIPYQPWIIPENLVPPY